VSDERPRSARRFALAPLLVYPLLGPAAVALIIAGPLALLSLFVLGPGGVLYYLFLGGWWLPALYQLLAAPFFAAGLCVAAIQYLRGRPSLLAALAAAGSAFAAYFAGWFYLLGIDASARDYANISSSLQSPSTAALVLLAATACWYVSRYMQAQSAEAAPPSPWQTWVWGAAAAIAAAAFAAVLAGSQRLPAVAWKECNGQGWDERIRGCTVIIERGPEEPVERRVTAYMRRGFAYDFLNRDLGKAIADYSEAIRLDPQLAEAYGRRGLAHARRGEDEQAIADLDTALRLDAEVLKPDTYQVFRSRGLAHFHRRELDAAVADHTEEIRRTPYYADGYLHRARAHLAKGELAAAIADFSEAIRVEPFRPEGYIERGSIYLAQGDAERALADFDELIRRHPNAKPAAPAYRKRGEILEMRGDFAGALAAYEKALSLDPSDQSALAGRDRMRAALGR
jgi:tetratricopeptide (TPR) repeat protein